MSGVKRPSPDLRRRSIINQAEKLLEQEGLASMPVDIEALAETRGILIQAKPDTDPGVSGMLLRYGDEFGILYATHVRSVGYQRFSIAHELGHYFLEGHAEILLPKPGTKHLSRAGFAADDPYEREADYFASGLLMPTDLFLREQRRRNDGLDAILEIAELCQSSITATAIRYADLSKSAVTVIVSVGEIVEFAFLSEGVKELKNITWIRKGSAVPRGSLTARLNADAGAVRGGEQRSDEVDVSIWLGGDRSVPGREEVLGLGAYGKTLTVLTFATRDETYGGDEVDDEEDLVDRWTPRFRR